MEQAEPSRGSSDFGALLRRYRLAANLSQEALAERARISVNGLGSLERGDRRNPRRETLALLCQALELSAEERHQFELAASLSPDARRGPSFAGPQPREVVTNLPFALSSFVGREREVAEIGALVRDHRMVTLTGAGGIGKTQTALHVAVSVHALDFGHARFIALAPVTIPSQVVATIASTLGVQQLPDRSPTKTLVDHLRSKRLLLLLDNCEHVIGEATIVAGEILNSCPGVRILATSRESLRAAGEYTYRLPTLAFPAPEDAAELSAKDASTYGALVLFRDRATAAEHCFALTDSNARVVAEICRRLDGIPLAIELAAARVDQLSVEAISEKLDDRFRILTGGSRNALPRQQTMRATIDWSYNLLTDREQRVFDRLSIFAGGCALDMATRICEEDEASQPEVFDVLTSLVAKSLLTADAETSETRYVLFESFRQYACDKLSERGEYRLVAHRHARAYDELACRATADPFKRPGSIFGRRMEQELDNWRAALRWTLVERGDMLLGQQIAAHSCGAWFFATPEGRSWIDLATQLVDAQTPIRTVADLAHGAAVIAWFHRDHERMSSASEIAIGHCRSVNDVSGLACSLTLAGLALASTDRLLEAKTALLEALELAPATDYPLLTAFVLRILAQACNNDHDIAGARRYTEEALSIARATDDVAIFNNPGAQNSKSMRIWLMLNGLAEYELFNGNAEIALDRANEVIAMPREGPWELVVAAAMNTAATSLIVLGRYDEAATFTSQALQIAREKRAYAMVGYTMQHTAAIAAFRPQDNAERLRADQSRAAQIVGFVNAYLLTIGSSRPPEELAQYERLMAFLRASLTPDALASFMELGAAMDEEQAIDMALG